MGFSLSNYEDQVITASMYMGIVTANVTLDSEDIASYVVDQNNNIDFIHNDLERNLFTIDDFGIGINGEADIVDNDVMLITLDTIHNGFIVNKYDESATTQNIDFLINPEGKVGIMF